MSMQGLGSQHSLRQPGGFGWSAVLTEHLLGGENVWVGLSVKPSGSIQCTIESWRAQA